MVSIGRASVVSVRQPHPGLLEAVVQIDGVEAKAFAYPDLTGPLEPGDAVLVNLTAVQLGLGTGGAHIVIGVEGRTLHTDPRGHAMKLRYTPAQTAVAVVEETHRRQVDEMASLDGLPVLAFGLHSALAPAAIGARAGGAARSVYVMTEGGALPLAVSLTVPSLRADGLIGSSITAGQSFGGDWEAVALPGALAAARAVCGADLVLAGMGPGNLGAGSRWGFGLIEVAAIVNTVAAMGGRPIAAPRISFAEQRDRHRGVSHHTLTALGLMLAPVEIVVPELDRGQASMIREQLAPHLERHRLIEQPLEDTEHALRRSPVPLHSMGRAYDDDPIYFRTPAAAGLYAARTLTSTR